MGLYRVPTIHIEATHPPSHPREQQELSGGKLDDSFTFWSSREQSSTTVSHSGALGSKARRQFHILELSGAQLDDCFTFWCSREQSSTTVSHSGALGSPT